MGESSTRIADAGSGNYIATRDAAAQAGGNDREITLVDQATRQAGFTYASPTRTITSLDHPDLGTDFGSLGSGITSNKLTVGDQSTLVVSAHINVTAGSYSFAVVPLILDDSNNVLGMLAPKSLQGYKAGSEEISVGQEPVSKYSIGYTASSNFYAICPLLSWRLNGAGPYIGLFFTGDRDDVNAKLYAALVSGGEAGFDDGSPDDYSDYGFTVVDPGAGE